MLSVWEIFFELTVAILRERSRTFEEGRDV